MKRAGSNHWWALAVSGVLVNVAVVILLLRTDTNLAVGLAVLMAVVLFLLAYRLTCTRRWWVLPLLSSPFIVIPFLLGMWFVLAIAGAAPVP